MQTQGDPGEPVRKRQERRYMRETEKERDLKRRMEAYTSGDVCVAFSGGVDSSLLLVLACEAARKSGAAVYAVTMDTVLHPGGDLDIAREVLSKTEAVHEVIYLDELSIPEIRKNPVDRCYLCKKALFGRILDFAREKNAAVVLEGSNEDDLHVYRPGLRAVRELGVKSPLAECGMTKAEVRQMAARYGISVAERPSTPCLATRLPYGAEISPELLRRIDQGESSLRSLGFGNVRVRVHGDTLRLEVDAADMPLVLAHREEILLELKKVGCAYITLDLEGFRSGSMDVHLASEKIFPLSRKNT